MKAALAKLGRKLGEFVRNSRKPILGLIGAGVSWAATKAGLHLDPTASATISGLVFAGVVRLARPIFGLKVKTPVAKADARGNLHVVHPR